MNVSAVDSSLVQGSKIGRTSHFHYSLPPSLLPLFHHLQASKARANFTRADTSPSSIILDGEAYRLILVNRESSDLYLYAFTYKLSVSSDLKRGGYLRSPHSVELS